MNNPASVPSLNPPIFPSSPNLPLPNPISVSAPQIRPIRLGHRQFAHPEDANPDVSYGDDVAFKPADTMRVFFQNIKGLTHSSGCEDYKYCLNSLSSLQVDIAGLTETNTPWLQAPHLQADFRHCMKRQFNIGKVVFGSADEHSYPIAPLDTYQAGGNLTLTAGSFVPMVLGSSRHFIQDPRGLGRWSGITLRGKNGKLLSLITGYRTCKSSIASASLGSTYHREYTSLKTSTNPTPDPRQTFIDDLTQTLETLKSEGHELLLMLDANSNLDDQFLATMLKTCQLHDIHRNFPAPSTYIGAQNRRIDHMFGSLQVANAACQQGSLSSSEGRFC